MARNTLIEAASVLCVLTGVTPKKMVIVGTQSVIIQSGRSRYYRLEYSHLYRKWTFGDTTVVTVEEMNALAASGALDDLLSAPAPQDALPATSGRKRWWQ